MGPTCTDYLRPNTLGNKISHLLPSNTLFLKTFKRCKTQIYRQIFDSLKCLYVFCEEYLS